MKRLTLLLPYLTLAVLLAAGLRWFQPAPRGEAAFVETEAETTRRYGADIRLDTLRMLLSRTDFADRLEVVPIEGALLIRSRPDRMNRREFEQVLLHGCPRESYFRLKPAVVLDPKPGGPEVFTLKLPMLREAGTHYVTVPYDVLSSVFGQMAE
jgi:hypothetical protein